MAGRLAGKVAIVTGAGSGIGRAVALRFGREGAAVVAAQRTLAKGREIVREIEAAGGRALATETDVTVPESAEAMVTATLDAFARVDVLCNNAGKGGTEDLLELTMEHYEAVMETNVRGSLLCTKYAVRAMLERGVGGSVINIASLASFIALPRSASYCASKGAVLALTRQVALDYASGGVRVNAIAPGYIDNEMFHSYCRSQPDPDASLADVLAAIPMGELGREEDVAAAAVFFASDESRWVTGATLPVDGGTLVR